MKRPLSSHTNPIPYSSDSDGDLLEPLPNKQMRRSEENVQPSVVPLKLTEEQAHGIEVSFRRENQPPIELAVYTPRAMQPDFDVKNVDIKCTCGKKIKLQVEYISESILPEIQNEPVISSQDSTISSQDSTVAA